MELIRPSNRMYGMSQMIRRESKSRSRRSCVMRRTSSVCYTANSPGPMIYYVEGNLFESPAQTLINTVNTVGVMGKGIAKQFKTIFPEMFQQYSDLCEKNQFKIGQLWLYKTPHKWILNFPTKMDWRQPSRPEYIEAGLKRFAETASSMGIHSAAFPALGCGNGELDWEGVIQPLMHRYLANLTIDIFIYPHKPSSDQPEHKKVREIKTWLLGEPQALPFTEVWRDIEAVLKSKHTFKTLAHEAPFTAEISGDPVGIRLQGKGIFFSYETLLNVWKQTRSYGFTARPLAPGGLEKDISYLAPILAELPYIRVVSMSETYKGLKANAAIGLQYIAPSQESSSNLDLFVNQAIRQQ